jgi:ectoine hydroxylase-related dioxygenase (phytanoyl-CoA dioxygenase family)
MTYVEHLWQHGYAVVRGVYGAADVAAMADEMDRLKAEALRYEASYRDRNLVYVIRPHPMAGRHLRFIHWPSYTSAVMARYRIDRRQLALVEPLIGNNLKQIANQATWKTPGTDDTRFGFHQDARFRRPASAFRDLATSYVQTSIAIDPHFVENGCLKVYPGSHQLGLLDLPADRSILDMESGNAALEDWGLDPDRMVDILLDPGDVALWLPHTLHASGPNCTAIDRRAYINGYVMADKADRGEWAFRNGEPCELGEPVLVQYEDLYTRPEPHYIEGALYPVKVAAG